MQYVLYHFTVRNRASIPVAKLKVGAFYLHATVYCRPICVTDSFTCEFHFSDGHAWKTLESTYSLRGYTNYDMHVYSY